MKNIYGLIAKSLTMKAFMFLLLFALSAPAVFAQMDDDVYFSPKDEVFVEEIAAQAQEPAEQYYEDIDYTDGYYDENYSDSQARTDGQGNTYITNNYYGDYYENDYTTRLNRFYTPYSGFGYYSPCYGGYYDPWYGYGGMSISIGWGWGYPYYGYGGGYWGGGYWGGGYPYYGWNSWYWGYPGYGYGAGYNHGYWNGYNNGYWNGYYDGYYGGDYYGGGYYYGPRRESGGYSSYRNDYAEKKTEQMGVAPGQQVNQFPVGENKDVIQPVRTGNVQPGTDAIKGNEMQPVRGNEPKPGGQHETIDRGNAQPAQGNEPKPNTNYNTIGKGDAKPVNQPARSNEAPVDKAPVAPKPGNTNKPNVQRQTEHNKGNNYSRPQRGNVEPKQPAKGNIPSPKPQERYEPKGNNKPSYNAPKTYDRGGYNAPSPSPAPAQRSPGGTMQRAPGGKGGMQPR